MEVELGPSPRNIHKDFIGINFQNRRIGLLSKRVTLLFLEVFKMSLAALGSRACERNLFWRYRLSGRAGVSSIGA